MKFLQPKNILYSPYFLAGIISLVIILFLPEIFSKYKIEIDRKEKTKYQDEIVYYSDLDNDGYSEKISSFISDQNHYCIQVFDHERGLIDQWNFTSAINHKSACVL